MSSNFKYSARAIAMFSLVTPEIEAVAATMIAGIVGIRSWLPSALFSPRDGNGVGDHYYNCRGQHETVHTWTPPPERLVPDELIKITLSLTSQNRENSPSCDYGSASSVSEAPYEIEFT
jgi:hypothetical protein